MDKIFNVAEKLKNKFATPLQNSLYEATSNENWAAPVKIQKELSDATFNYNELSIICKYIMEIIVKAKWWKRILKALNLIEYILKNGNPKCQNEFKDEIYHIKKLNEFQFFEEHQDKGLSVREKSKFIIELLRDDKKLAEEREASKQLNDRLQGLGFNNGGQKFASSSIDYQKNQDSWNINSIRPSMKQDYNNEFQKNEFQKNDFYGRKEKQTDQDEFYKIKNQKNQNKDFNQSKDFNQNNDFNQNKDFDQWGSNFQEIKSDSKNFDKKANDKNTKISQIQLPMPGSKIEINKLHFQNDKSKKNDWGDFETTKQNEWDWDEPKDQKQATNKNQVEFQKQKITKDEWNLGCNIQQEIQQNNQQATLQRNNDLMDIFSNSIETQSQPMPTKPYTNISQQFQQIQPQIQKSNDQTQLMDLFDKPKLEAKLFKNIDSSLIDLCDLKHEKQQVQQQTPQFNYDISKMAQNLQQNVSQTQFQNQQRSSKNIDFF